nr:MAG TPA: hypothetical protein [Caudoviricetes sp.]
MLYSYSSFLYFSASFEIFKSIESAPSTPSRYPRP